MRPPPLENLNKVGRILFHDVAVDMIEWSETYYRVYTCRTQLNGLLLPYHLALSGNFLWVVLVGHSLEMFLVIPETLRFIGQGKRHF
jgi:hypothetical protein